MPPVSPTGLPLLPSWVPKYAAALVAIAAAVLPLLPKHPTIAGQICQAVIGMGAALGIVSQGWRSKPAGLPALLGAMPDLPLPAEKPAPMTPTGPTFADPGPLHAANCDCWRCKASEHSDEGWCTSDGISDCSDPDCTHPK